MPRNPIASVTLRVNLKIGMGEVIEKGTRFTPPFPDYIQREINHLSVKNPTLDVEYGELDDTDTVNANKPSAVRRRK